MYISNTESSEFLMKKIYLHIGYPKTGTSAIQKMVSINDNNLIENGILYPNECRVLNRTLDLEKDSYVDHKLPLSIMKNELKPINNLIKEINGSDPLRRICQSHRLY
jgi:hypothetical protein